MITLLVEDIMCDQPIKVKESISVGNVTHLLMRYRINGILITKDDDEEKVIGIYTTTDALRLMDEAISTGAKKIKILKKLSDMPVGQVASKGIISLQKDAKVTKAIAVMHKKNVHTIPIFDGDKLVGVIGRHDVLNIALS